MAEKQTRKPSAKRATEGIPDTRARQAKPKPKAGPEPMIEALRGALRKEYTRADVPTATETHELSVVLPCPVVMEYLWGISGLPIARVYELSAPNGTGKTSLFAEMGRWVCSYLDGLFIPIENDSKLDLPWIEAVLQDAKKNCQPITARSSDDVIDRCVYVINGYKSLTLKEAGKRGWAGVSPRPLLVGPDPLSGHQARSIQERVIGKAGKGEDDRLVRHGGGEAIERTFSVESGQFAKFFRTMPTMLEGWPIVFVTTNQLRVQEGDTAYSTKISKAGGDQVNFAKSYELHLFRGAKIATSAFEGHRVTIKMTKNSGGARERKMTTRLFWWTEGPPGARVRKAYWDWDWALVNLLVQQSGDEAPSPVTRQRLKECGLHFKIEASGDTTNAAWSANLGHRGKQDAVSWAELGRQLAENPETLKLIRHAFEIQERPAYTPAHTREFIRLAQAKE